MAVIVNPNDPNNQQQNAPQGTPDGQPLQTVGTATPSGQAPSGSPRAMTQANNLAQRQGSGRFTNLSKYLQANQGAGQRIAGQIGQKVGQQLSKEQEKAQQYYGKLGETIAQSKQVAQQGSQFQQQLGQLGQQIKGATLTPEQLADQQQAQQALAARPQQDLSAIQSFTQAPEFQQFQNIQAGRGIDENLLALQQQRAYQQALATQQQAQQAQQQLGSETGRFELLRQQFGGAQRPGYTVGQQRLDQALLGGGLGGLRSDVQSRLKAAQEQSRLAGGQAQEVGRLAAQEQDIIGALNKEAAANEQAYLDMLQSYADPLQRQRQAEFEGLGAATATYVPTIDPVTGKVTQQTWQPGYTAEQMARLGLTDANTGVYNVFQDEAFTQAMKEQDPAKRNAMLANVIASKGMEARTAQDVANQEDLARYKALQSIIGKQAADRLTGGTGKVGEEVIGKSYEAKTGKVGEADTGLKERLAAAQQQFESKGPFTASGRGKSFGIRELVGQSDMTGSASAEAKATLQDLINKGRAGAIGTSRFDFGQTGTGYTMTDQQLQDRANVIQNIGYAPYQRSNGGNIYDVSPEQLISERQALQSAQQQNVIDQFRDYLAQQNYARTLGGRRETFLDTEARQRASDLNYSMPIKESAPVTGQDPSLAYLNDIVAKMPIKGS